MGRGVVAVKLNGEEEDNERECSVPRQLQQQRLLVVGYALTSKKVKSFMQPKLEMLARKKGILFVPIDTNRCLADQGPFDVVLHKLLGKEWRQDLEDYREQHPEVTVLDPPDAIQHVHNRQTMLKDVADLNLSNAYGEVRIPRQLVVNRDPSSIPDAVSRAGLNLPLVAKPLLVDGSARSHALSLAFDQLSLSKLDPPLVLQEFVNHGGVLFKVYIVGEAVKVVRRFSLPDVDEQDNFNNSGVFQFPRVSCAAASADEADLDPSIAELPPRALLEKLARELRRRLGLRLFNLDIIRKHGTRDRYYVIDINYFPGYGKMPGYEQIFTDFLLELVQSKSCGSLSSIIVFYFGIRNVMVDVNELNTVLDPEGPSNKRGALLKDNKCQKTKQDDVGVIRTSNSKPETSLPILFLSSLISSSPTSIPRALTVVPHHRPEIVCETQSTCQKEAGVGHGFVGGEPEFNRTLYPLIEPYSSGFLKVSGIHTLYWEQSGNPDGYPVVFPHGGPGGGTVPGNRRFFDPEFYRIILFDQRGAGKSTPHACLEENTTWDLVDDIEKIRKHLDISEWQVFGGSWGSTLALTYSISHPDKASFLLRKKEIDWFYEGGAAAIFPDAWESFRDLIPENERDSFITAYNKRLNAKDLSVQHEAARAWTNWELMTTYLIQNENHIKRGEDDAFALAFARIENHFFINKVFFSSDSYLLDNIEKIRHIKTIIVQGRYDVCCPMVSAWDLHKAWPEAELKVVADAGHSANEPGIASELVAANEKFKYTLRK